MIIYGGVDLGQTNVQLDGKTIAKASAPYMRSELDKLNKRQNRLGGR